MTIICGWDVGIKNLAYCVLVNNDGQFHVLEWKIIDLIGNKEYKCELCKVKASYSQGDKFYCKRHKDTNYKIESPVECEISSMCEYSKCKSKAKFNLYDKNYCNRHTKTEEKKQNRAKKATIIKKKKCNNNDPQTICKTLYNQLDRISIFDAANEIYIENQPVLKNPIMKTISCVLFGYFVNRYIDKETIIKFAAPKIIITDELLEFCKTKFHSKQNDDCKCKLCRLENDMANKTKKYENKKLLGILNTEQVLIKHGLGHKFDEISNIKKKDDLCDAFLHAYNKM